MRTDDGSASPQPGDIETESDIQRSGYRALRSVPGVLRLLSSSALARTAARMYVILLILFALATYHSPAVTGLVVLASQIPGLLTSPIAGALLDRRGRLALIRLDFFTASVAIALMTALGLAHLLPMWALFVIVTLASLTQPLSATGTRSLFPLIVPRPLWDRANGLDGSSFVCATIFGPAIAGVAVTLVGVRYCLLAPVLLYLAAGGVLIGVRAPEPAPHPDHVLKSAAAALRYVFTHKTLRQLAAMSTVYNGFIGTLNVVIPVLVINHLHGGSATVGLMLAVIGIGGAISTIFTGAIGISGREHALMAGACVASGLSLSLLALVFDNEVFCYLAFFVIGLTNGPFNITVFGVRQRVTDPEWFGRAFAISMSINGIGTPIGSAIIGVIISHSLALALLLAGVCTLLAAGWTIAFPLAVDTPEPVVRQPLARTDTS